MPVVVADQPEPQVRPFLGRLSTESSLRLARPKSKSKPQSPIFGIFARQRNQSDASSRKILISAPTDFRHLTSGSQHAFPAMPFNMHSLAPELPRPAQRHEFLRIPRSPAPIPDWEPESQRESLPPLEPLELSIYRTQNRLSPLLPQFELPIMVPSPPPAYASEEAERSPVLHSQRSMPSLSRASRRAVLERLSPSPYMSEGNSSSKSLTSTSSTAKGARRSRSQTSPDVNAIRARVANAMLEVEKLQKQIDDVVERQSLYVPSRPSSAQSSHSLARTFTLPDLEPMPSIPALPPSAPSFAERLHGEADRLPPGPATLPRRSHTVNGAGAQRTRSQRKPPPPLPVGFNDFSDGIPPPLPLVLRPPLRKKKPFSQGLSSFVFPEPPRKSSLDSVTNMPRPIKGADGFYQCVPVNGANISYESLHSLSSSNDGDMSEARSVRSPYSPATPREVPIERCATFGQDTKGLPMSVGIAL
ncbi:hypothetical protein PWT90_03629 [Aphanocladium album]|nr:hypothetical protein PWT90_03629 [Aphanocladium album]